MREARNQICYENKKFKKAKHAREEYRYTIECAYLRHLYQILIKGDVVTEEKYKIMITYADALGKPTPDHFTSMSKKELHETGLFENKIFTNYLSGFMLRNSAKKLKPIGKKILDDQLKEINNRNKDNKKD